MLLVAGLLGATTGVRAAAPEVVRLANSGQQREVLRRFARLDLEQLDPQARERWLTGALIAGVRLQQPAALARALEALAADAPPEGEAFLRGSYLPHARLLVAAQADDCDRAAAQLPALAGSARLAQSTAAVAHCHARRGEHDRGLLVAGRALRAARDAGERCLAWSTIGALHERAGQGGAALRAYRNVWIDCPRGRTGREAEARLRAVAVRFGLRVAPKDGAELEREAEVWLRAGAYGRADLLLAQVEAQAEQRGAKLRRADLRFARAQIAEHLGRYRPALGWLDDILQTPGLDAHRRGLALLLRAEIQARRGRYDEALDDLDAVGRGLQGRELACEARWRKGSLEIKLGRPRLALQALSQSFTEPEAACREPDLVDKARWLLAWRSWRAGEVPAAQALATPAPAEPARAYWYGRWAARDGGSLEQRAALAALAMAHPLGLYPQAAREQGLLPRLAPTLLRPTRGQGATPMLDAAHPDLRSAQDLARRGFSAEAQRLARGVSSRWLAPPDRLALAQLRVDEEDHYLSNVLARGGSAALRLDHPELGAQLDLLYPRPFEREVLAAARRARVSPALIFGVMHQESAFNERALSNRQARGLMQLLLPTARSMARLERVERVTAARLYDPALNIRLGARYLGELQRRYGGEPILVLAAYHAGERAVDRWVRRNGHLPRDVFLEELPFEGTRGYVRVTLAATLVYAQRYYPRQAPRLALTEPFPARLVERIARLERRARPTPLAVR